MSEYTDDQHAALNAAAERFMKIHPGAANRNWVMLDLSVGDLPLHACLTRACELNASKAAGGCRGSRPAKYKVRAYEQARREQDAWLEMKRQALAGSTRPDSS